MLLGLALSSHTDHCGLHDGNELFLSITRCE